MMTIRSHKCHSDETKFRRWFVLTHFFLPTREALSQHCVSIQLPTVAVTVGGLLLVVWVYISGYM